METKEAKKKRNPWLLALVGAVALTLPSCALLAVGAVAGTVAYLEGELVGTVPGDMYQSVGATKKVVSSMRLTPQKEVGDEQWAQVIALDESGTRISVKLMPESSNLTRVRIRVGLGNEAYSRLILSEIQRAIKSQRSSFGSY